MRLGVVGVGSMGGAVAERLLGLGYRVAVWDLDIEKVRRCAGMGAVPSSSLQDLVEKSETVIASLPSPQAVRETFLDSTLLDAIRPGTIVVDLSTVDPETSREAYQSLKARGVHYLDAPVSGGPRRAAAGKLTITAGGDPDAFQRCEKLLRQLGEKVFYMGGPGSGSVFKLINQLLVFAHAYAAMEALTLCKTLGLDTSKMYEVVTAGSGNSFIFQEMVRMALSGEVWGGRTSLLIKDINLTHEIALKAGADLRLCRFLKETADRMAETGYGQDDAVRDFSLFVEMIALTRS
jgi:3-hydroxyisobutyrate dehydrogenase-like beta-hydroxyacid dehydrogenase